MNRHKHNLSTVPMIHDRRPSRHGLSIMEVLFAIAVLTIGMLGVAAILPVATNNASMALKTDRAVEEFSNRVATEVSKLGESFDEVKVAHNSFSRFRNNTSLTRGLRFENIDTGLFGNHIGQYEKLLASTSLNQPNLPDAFCIDPWFMSAASALRDDDTDPSTTRNGYDRTMFPCYDPRLDLLNVSPTAALSNSVTGGATLTKVFDTPRFTRVGLTLNGSSLFPANNAEFSARRSDDFSIVIPNDRTRPPGIFVQRGGNGVSSPAKNTVSSRYSSMVTMARSAPGSSLFNAAVVTMFDRQIVTIAGGYFDGHLPPPAAGDIAAHNMRPYTAWLPDDPAAPNSFPQDHNQIYPGEMIGYVSYAPRPISGGGGGEFVFRTQRNVRPSVRDGHWLMLMRQEYIRTPTPAIVPTTLKYGWYRVSDVISGPALVTVGGTEYYETHVSVRGQDWLFHPIQSQIFPPPLTQYGPPYFGNIPQPTWGAGTVFNYDGVLADPAGYNNFDYGTSVVLMPDVVNVKQFQVQL